MMSDSPSADVTAQTSAAVISFGFHPDHSLRFSLHNEVTEPASVAKKVFSYGDDCGRFGLVDSSLIQSPTHLAVAANAALFRNDGGGGGGRGLAAETVLCAAGTTHAGNAMRELAFDGAGATSVPAAQPVTVLAFAYGIDSDSEYSSFLSTVGLVGTAGAASKDEMEDYFGRERSAAEVAEVVKMYRLTEDEVHMVGSSLEKAVLTRIGSKFSV